MALWLYYYIIWTSLAGWSTRDRYSDLYMCRVVRSSVHRYLRVHIWAFIASAKFGII